MNTYTPETAGTERDVCQRTSTRHLLDALRLLHRFFGYMACDLRWVPYKADARMGLNHQMASLSCAMNEASYLRRTLLLPSMICMDRGHDSGGSCVPFESLFDVELLNSVVAVRLTNNGLQG